MQTQMAIASRPAVKNDSLLHRVWPAAVIIVGFVLNAAWVALLGYGLVSVVRLAL
jgi:hypothetical protein